LQTETLCWTVNTLASYWGGPRFDSQYKEELCWLMYFLVSSNTSKQLLWHYSHDHFHKFAR
jgi:hypothetical protein